MNFKFLHLLVAFSMLCASAFSQVKVEGETATASGDAVASVAGAGASGGAYARMNSGDLSYTVTLPAAGLYTVKIVYKSGSDKNNLFVTDGSSAVVHFPNTSDVFQSVSTLVRFNAGANSFSMKKDWGWIDIDYFEFTPFDSGTFSVSNALVTSESTEAAQKLYSFLYENFEKKTISGVMIGDVNTSATILNQEDVKIIKNVSGKNPALVGFDFLFANGVNANDAWYKAYTDQCVKNAAELWELGGIPAFTWHWKDPSHTVDAFYTYNGNKTTYTDFDFTKGFKPGTTEWDVTSETYKQIIEDIDEIAVYFKKLQSQGVAAIFRPLHESGGNWFWWSVRGGKAFTALYELVYDRMTNHNGVKNLVWVYNPERSVVENADWQVDARCYDVLSVDIYNDALDLQSNYSAFIQFKSASGGKKILALSENGPITDVDNMHADGAVWSWWMPWYSTWVDKPENAFYLRTPDDKWVSNMADDRVITLDEMPGWGTFVGGGEEENPGDDACSDNSNPLKIEAECMDFDASLCEVVESAAMSNGKGVNLKDDASALTYTFSTTKACGYKIYVGYHLKYGYKECALAVNGISKPLKFGADSGAEAADVADEVLVGSYSFKKGDNVISVLPVWTWAVIDYIRLEEDNSIPVYEIGQSDSEGYKVIGNKLFDPCGNEFIMRGVNLAYTWFVSTAYNQLEAVKNAGANTVRVVLSNGKAYGKAADSAKDVMAFANKVKEYGMLTVLEVHDVTGSNKIEDLEGAAKYFADMASSLKGTEDYIIINIANEWHNDAASTVWRDGYKSAIKIIRDAGLRHCIMVDAGGYGQGASTIHSHGVEVLASDPDFNVMYSIHMYGGAGNTSKVKLNIDGVINQDLALCIGEFGWYHSDGDVDEDLIMSYSNEKGVSWLAWSWYGNGSPVEYLDIVKDASNNPVPASYTNLKVKDWSGKELSAGSCEWGKKVIDAMKAEARFGNLDKTSCEGSSVSAVKKSDADVFYINAEEKLVVKNNAGATIVVTDVLGRSIYSDIVNGNDFEVSASEWNSGVYTVSVDGNVIKVVK